MAVYGIGREYDLSLKAGSTAQTTTSQYKTVAISAANEASIVATATALTAIGINQSYLSTGSESLSARVAGVSKAVCNASITAGQFVQSAIDGSGKVDPYSTITAEGVVLGMALETGSTNTVISVNLQPQLLHQ